MTPFRLTKSLKRALAFALCCLFIFLFSQQAFVSGDHEVRVTDERDCCRNCGSASGCTHGTTWLDAGYQECDLIEDEHGQVIGCKVDGDYCECV